MLDPERPSAHSTPSEESPAAFLNGVEPGVVNGHIPVRKRYIESSLDELAMEIEAYEHREERPKPAGYHSDAHEEPELPKEPPSPPVIIETPEAGPSRETEQKEEEEAMTIVELLKTTEEVQLLTFYFLNVLPTYLPMCFVSCGAKGLHRAFPPSR